MASGIYAQVDLAASTNTTVFTITTFGVYNVRFCNRNSTPVQVRLAYAATGTPTGAEYVEYGETIPANGALEEQGVAIQAGKLIVAYSNTANVSVAVWGIE